MKKFIKIIKSIIIVISVLLPIVGEAIHTIKPKLQDIGQKDNNVDKE